MKKALKTALYASAVLAVSSATFSPVAVMAWGDSDGNSRKSYTIEEIDSGVLGDNIVLNSISNSVAGDEKNFVSARELDGKTKDTEAVWSANEITVEDGKDYIVSMYVHNNNPNGTKAVATGVTTTFAIDQSSASELKIQGQIDTDNASPKSYWDGVIFKSKDGSNFHLDFYKDSGLLENNGIGKNGGVRLDDKIVTEGVKIGYDALDGRIPGCYQYASYVSIKVKAVYDTNFTVNKEVRMAGTKDKFGESVDAKVGDLVEFQITYENTSDGVQKGVTVKDVMPTNLEYQKGTTKLYNGQINGLTAEDTLTTDGLQIGSYEKDSVAVIRYIAKVVDNDLYCGDNELNNWAQVSINGTKVLQDNAIVNTNKVCKEEPKDEPKTCETNPEMEGCKQPDPEVLPSTGAEFIGSALGAGALTTVAGYYISSRRKLNR
ncbi:DUF11 domain-containing protein [Candidatus Saccharibacteria bacterium]|nr:DUF11 domain-containing protein [Candidatus Saccharibacteria bacterium]